MDLLQRPTLGLRERGEDHRQPFGTGRHGPSLDRFQHPQLLHNHKIPVPSPGASFRATASVHPRAGFSEVCGRMKV